MWFILGFRAQVGTWFRTFRHMKQRPIETFPSRNSTVSSGAYFAPPHILDFIKNLHKMLHKQFFIITLQNNFFLACFDWSRAFNFRIYFDFWWKTYTKRCTNKFVLKNFVRLHFTVDQMLSISEYDWENGRIRVSKTMPLGNCDFDFVPLLFTVLTFSQTRLLTCEFCVALTRKVAFYLYI